MSSFSQLSDSSRSSQITNENISEDSSSGSSESNYTLSEIQADACVTILENAIDQLKVLGQLGNLPKNIEADLTYKSPQDRFSKSTHHVSVFDRETMDTYQLALYKEKFSKFQMDRSFVEKILKDTMTNLLETNCYKCMVEYLNQYNIQVQDEGKILKDEIINKTKVDELKALVEKERRKLLSVIQNLSASIGNLQGEVEGITILNKIKKAYAENWENSRIEQSDYALDKAEEYYINFINQKKNDIENEIRIHAEIEMFIEQKHHERQEEILMWMERYDKGIEQKDLEIRLLKKEREDQMNQLHEFHKIYENRKIQIAEYLAEKERSKLEAELFKKRTETATKIQTWWRSVMVKRNLGEFSKHTRDKKQKKKK